MNRNLRDFCRRLAAHGATQRKVPPPVLADHFCRYFKLSLRPRLVELTQVLQEAGVGVVSGAPLPQGLLGVHFSATHWGYHIQYREDQWEAGKEHTVLHETYEIIQELLFPRRPNGDMARLICRDADKFAAAVLMQGRCFADFAEVTGLDIVEMQRLYQCSYASVTRRLAEVLEGRPLVAMLYERRDRSDPHEWPHHDNPDDFSVRVAAWTKGGSGLWRALPIGGKRGSMPARGRPSAPGSLAEQVVLHGEGVAVALQPWQDGAGRLGVAAMARPVYWHGRLAKIAVTAVPYRDRAILLPQLPRIRGGRKGAPPAPRRSWSVAQT